MCTFKQAFRFLVNKIKGVDYGAIFVNGERKIVETEKLHKLNILIRDEMGESGKISKSQVQRIMDLLQSLGKLSQQHTVPVPNNGPYKYFNAKSHYGTTVFDDNSKLLISIPNRVQLPSFYRCLSYL